MGATAGCLVTLEGGEGAGKTTQCRLLREWLVAGGLSVTCTREPGGTVLGERLRALVLDPELGAIAGSAEMLLFSAARAETVARIILPALERNEVVLCDRFVDSSQVYQGHGLGVDREFIAAVNGEITAGAVVDLTLVLDVPVETGHARRRAERPDRIETRGLTYHQKVRAGYRRLAAEEPNRVRLIDATRPVATIQRELRELVAMALARRGLSAPAVDREGAAP